MNKSSVKMETAVGFSVSGCLLIILFLALVNFLTTPGIWWWQYPAFAVLWWPLSLAFCGKKCFTGFSVAGSFVGIGFFACLNWLVTPAYLWFYHAAFALIWWPLSMAFSRRKAWRGFSVAGALLTLSYLTLTNFLESPFCPWVLFAVVPVLFWPIIMIAGKKAGTVIFSLMASGVTIGYYLVLNLFVFPGFPWVICPAFAVLWWPLSVWFARTRRPLAYSVAGTILITLFFASLNFAATPDSIWFLYPVFAVLWWPLSVYYYIYRKNQ